MIPSGATGGVETVSRSGELDQLVGGGAGAGEHHQHELVEVDVAVVVLVRLRKHDQEVAGEAKSAQGTDRVHPKYL